VQRLSLVEEVPVRQVRMANLAILGTHSINGVAAIRSKLVRTQLVPEFAEIFSERFNNKTNGVTPRRWLRLANPALANLLSEALGDGWVSNLDELRGIIPLAEDASFRSSFRKAKQAARVRFADWLKATTGNIVDPSTIFDSQLKRIHEYKRQLLNVLHIVILYNRLRDDPSFEIPPRTFFFAGKAAPAYRLAKLIIKLINQLGTTIEADPAIRHRIKVVFVPNYSVTVAELLIPASDVSEQISTAGYEASGTSNMKFNPIVIISVVKSKWTAFVQGKRTSINSAGNRLFASARLSDRWPTHEYPRFRCCRQMYRCAWNVPRRRRPIANHESRPYRRQTGLYILCDQAAGRESPV
jgi:glycogen phosphorylase